jgi:hypothetical protein
MSKIKVEEIKKAVEIALQEYDKETILDIVKNEDGGWGNGAEALNNVDPIVLRRIIYTEM